MKHHEPNDDPIGTTQLSARIGEDAIASGCIERYLEVLERYRSTLNLVSPTSDSAIHTLVRRSHRYAELIHEVTKAGDTVVDVGSGAGIPGLIVACTLRDRRIVLVERRRRRANFLDVAQAHMGLENAEVLHGDVENASLPKIGAFTAQSVMTFDRLYCATRHLHAESIVLVSGKGDSWRTEVLRLTESIGTAPAEAIDRPDSAHGRLIALRLEGGRPCRSSG